MIGPTDLLHPSPTPHFKSPNINEENNVMNILCFAPVENISGLLNQNTMA
jgi:hypothetical protein